ncbi:MAG: stage III sporulation protein AB [Clostridiales bacterium]|nr:stage III sporulation protein AB [Clostridiales bacterium]
MLLKGTGTILVLSGCMGMGWLSCQRLMDRERQMDDIQSLIRRIQGEIRVTESPLGHIFFRLSRQTDEPYTSILKTLAERMERQEGTRFREMWEQVWKEGFQREICRDDWESLLELGKELGYLDVHMQIQVLDDFLQDWERRTEKCRRDRMDKQKVYRCLGVSSGIFLVLLLL